MITEEHNKYEEWLTTIANTRLLFNTVEELENYLENHSIHSNGIRRSIVGQARLRSVFRDLKVEAALMTDGLVDLDKMLMRYKSAWNFFKANLSRRNDPTQIAMELLHFCYPPYQSEGLGKKKARIFGEVINQNINVPFLILMLLKIIPGYDSKEGDVINIAYQYEQAMEMMEHFSERVTVFSVLPSITKARGEKNKTRFMLLYHISQILDTYESFIDSENMYVTSSEMKASSIDLELDGYWNECEGKLLYTDFWQIECTLNSGSYFATKWHKDSTGALIGTRYTMFLNEAQDGRLSMYMLHPESIRNRMKGKEYGDGDHVWYVTDMPEGVEPNKLLFVRCMASNVWKQHLHLTRVTDEVVIAQYENWFKKCDIRKMFEELEYEFHPNIYAITNNDIYVPTGTDGEYYKIPRNAVDGFEQIKLNDNVGLMKMNGSTYIAFDEMLLYIPTSKNSLKKYGIEKVYCIV